MTSGEESGGERGFKIVDRRGGEGEEVPASEPAAAAGAPEAGPAPSDLPPGTELPRIDFPTFVLSLGTSAMVHMGLVADPETGQPSGEKNLVFARQTIDTLEMLQAKTRGNLEQEEAHLLESLLYDLRMHFVEASR